VKPLSLCGFTIATVAILIAIGSPATGAPPAGGTPGSSLPLELTPPPITGGPAPDLALVFSSQVAGWIEPCG